MVQPCWREDSGFSRRLSILAGELGRKPFQAFFLTLQTSFPRPGAFEIVAIS